MFIHPCVCDSLAASLDHLLVKMNNNISLSPFSLKGYLYHICLPQQNTNQAQETIIGPHRSILLLESCLIHPFDYTCRSKVVLLQAQQANKQHTCTAIAIMLGSYSTAAGVTPHNKPPPLLPSNAPGVYTRVGVFTLFTTR